MAITTNKFGVPVNGARFGILQPKLKYRFRVEFTNFGPIGAQVIELTRNVMSVTRPKVSHEEVPIHSYNSVAYIQGKHTWEAIQLTLRDDISNQVSGLVGQQVQKQMNHFEQTSSNTGSNYKFNTTIDILNGDDDSQIETWSLEGCFLQNVDYSDADYSTSEPVQVLLTIKYDNAIHENGLFPVGGVTGIAGDNVN